MAFAADRINAKRMKKRIDQKFGGEGQQIEAVGATQFTLAEFYNHLIPEEQGKKHETKEE